jgi:hypothetical protein
MCFRAGHCYEQSCPAFCLGVEVQHVCLDVFMYVCISFVSICVFVFMWVCMIIHVCSYDRIERKWWLDLWRRSFDMFISYNPQLVNPDAPLILLQPLPPLILTPTLNFQFSSVLLLCWPQYEFKQRIRDGSVQSKTGCLW